MSVGVGHGRAGAAPALRRAALAAASAGGLVPTAEVPGSPSPEGIAISRDGRWALVTLQGRDRVITIDLPRGAITAYAPTGTWSDGIGYSPIVRAAAAGG